MPTPRSTTSNVSSTLSAVASSDVGRLMKTFTLSALTSVAAVLTAAASTAAPALAQVSPVPAWPGDTTVAASAANQRTPALAAGNGTILAVWQDSRTSPIFTGEQSGQDIWGALLDADGVPLADVAFPINMDGGDQRSPAVAWNGTEWLVAWVGQVTTTSFYTEGLLATRVAADGTVLDPVPIVVRADLGSGTFGDVASDGNGWAVFFTGWQGATSHVYGARIAADGTLLDATPKIVATPGSSPNTPNGVTAGWATGGYLVAWSQWSSSGLDNVRGQRANASLTPLGATFNIATSTDYEVHPDVASNGAQFFVVWDRYNNCCVGGASKVYGTRVTTAGAVLDGTIGLPIYDTNGYGFQGCEPAVAWDGSQWVASWTEPDTGGLRVNAGRISASGVVLDFNGFEVEPLPQRQEASAIVGRPGGGSLVVWQDSRVVVGQPNDVHAAQIDASGFPVPLGALALSARSQVHADGASLDGGGALVAWTSMESGSTHVMVRRTSSSGAPLGLPVSLATGAQLGDAHVAWNGSIGLVTWQSTPNGVYGRRIDSDGQPIDPAPFLVMPGSRPDVAAQGDTFLVTALIPEANPQLVYVRGRRVSGATGALLDASPFVIGATYATAQSLIAFDGGFLLAWEIHPTHDDPWSNVGLRLVSAAGVPGAQSFLSSASTYNARPTLAAGAGVALVSWQSGPSYSLAENVVARIVGPGLTLPGSLITVSSAPISQQVPAVGFDGTNFVVAWQDSRSTTAYLIDRRTDIYAARVTPAGVVLDPAGIALATDSAPEAWPMVESLGGNAVLVTWSDFEAQQPFASYRLGSSVLGTPTPWTALEHALPGSFGTPAVTGTGSLVPGTGFTLQLVGAPLSSPGAWVVGSQAAYLPFAGGVIVPTLDFIVPLTTNAFGAVTVGSTWPLGSPPGSEVYFQSWIFDLAASGMWSASNGLLGTTP